MEDYNDNIPDENIKIISPKKCFFLLNKMNMFINTEKKRINYENFMKRNQTAKEKDNSKEDSEDLKTIIKEPGILANNILLDIRSLIKPKRKNKREMKGNYFEKLKKNAKVSLYKNKNSKEDLNNKLNNNIKNIQQTNKRKINIKNDKKQHQSTNLTQTPKIKNNESCYNKEITFYNNKINEKKNLIPKNKEKYINSKNTNKIFVKKLSKEIKNRAVKNSLSINKKEKEREKQGIITKKILIRPSILPLKNNMEQKKIFYLTQKELMPNIHKELLNNKDISSNNNIKIINHFSQSNKNLLEEKNKFKSKIFHIDYSNYKKIDLTKIIIGLNAIKDLFYKKLKKNFLKLKQIYIYKKKIINNNMTTPKQNRYTIKEKVEFNQNDFSKENDKGENTLSIEQKNLNISNSEINKKTFQTMHKFYNYYKKNNNINEFDIISEKKTKTNNIFKYKKNNVLLLNRNSYINNCNINSIQINLFNNEDRNKINENIIKNNDIKTKIMIEQNSEKSFDESNLIKTSRTSYKRNKK